MTEQDKNLIIQLWESGEPSSSIIRLLPYNTRTAKSMIMELRQNGVLKGQSGKSRVKTWEKVLQAYNNGITSPYDLSKMFLLKVGTVNTILSNSGLHRIRPKKNYKAYPIGDKTKEIIEEIKSGETLTEIAKKYGTSRQYVHKLKEKYCKGINND